MSRIPCVRVISSVELTRENWDRYSRDYRKIVYQRALQLISAAEVMGLSGKWVSAKPGDWLLEDQNGYFYTLTDEEFWKQFQAASRRPKLRTEGSSGADGE